MNLKTVFRQVLVSMSQKSWPMVHRRLSLTHLPRNLFPVHPRPTKDSRRSLLIFKLHHLPRSQTRQAHERQVPQSVIDPRRFPPKAKSKFVQHLQTSSARRARNPSRPLYDIGITRLALVAKSDMNVTTADGSSKTRKIFDDIETKIRPPQRVVSQATEGSKLSLLHVRAT